MAVAGSMLPYVHVDDLDLLGLKVHPFGLLVGAAVTVGIWLAKRRARLGGLNVDMLDSMIGCMLFVGFASAHVLDEILYRPHQVIERPWSLVFFWEGIGSFSGWLGALLGVLLWRSYDWRKVWSFGPWKLGQIKLAPLTLSRPTRRPKKLPVLPFADVILSVFPIAWILGRSGCSVAHDHPGTPAADGAALAVAFPSSNPWVSDGPGDHVSWGPLTVVKGHFPRYDLGTVELIFTIALALVFVFLWRRRRVTGTYATIICLVYPPARFLMEFLRLSDRDPRYAGLTPAQWLSVAMMTGGLVLLRHVLRIRASGKDTIPAALAAVPPE